MMKNKKPAIRFKGFSEEWEDKNYSETFINIPNNTLSRAELNYNYGLAKNVHYGDVLIKYKELLDVQKEEIPYITNDSFAIKLSALKLQNGDVIIADAAEDETVGKCTEVVNIGEETVFSGLHTIPVRPSLSFASGYLGYFMNSPAYHTQLLRLMQGTKVLSISKTAIQNTSILFPNDKTEQTQIGNFFKNLDSLITLHQRKYEKLGILKKAMLEKMFPKNGKDFPEIRFKGFEGAWEEMKLGEVTSYTKGFAFKSEHFTTNGKRIIRVSDLGVDDIRNDSEKIFISDENINGLEKYKILKDEIIITTVGSKPELIESAVGRGILVRESEVGYLNQNSLKITNSNFANNGFIYGLLNSKDYGNHILQIQRGNANQSNITVSDLFEFKIKIPTVSEQEKIGNYFKNLDNLLTLHQGELGKLKNLKKAMLEKMFV
jgi:type I restriction enzyme, S subunit